MSAKLAVEGGNPAKTTPNPGMYPGGLAIDEEEKKELIQAIDRKHLFRYYMPDGMASKVSELEALLAERTGSRHCLATNSGTSALVSAFMACGVGPGHEVIIPSVTYWSSAASVLDVRAVPIIAEVDDSISIEPSDIENKITPRTKAIMPVHMRGAPCDMDPIMEIARKHDLAVIEDSAQAMGGSYRGKMLGSLGDCGCFSMHYYKTITSGEGGFLTTDDERIYTLAQSAHDSAACWRPDRFAPERFPGELSYGFDFRMSELAGAVGLAQLRKLPGLRNLMRKNKKRILDGIKGLPGVEFRRMNDSDGDTATCIIFFVPTVKLCEKSVKALKAEGVDAMHLYHRLIPDWSIYAHWQHMIDRRTPTPEGCPYTCPHREAPPPEYSKDMCPRTIDLVSRAVHINVPPQLTDDDCDAIAEGIRKVVEAYL